MLLSATIPMAMPSDALADNGKLYSGGAIDSSGRFSLTAVEFMEELISVMNSNTALSALDATFSALGDSSISLSPEFTYYYQDESFYILQYTGMEIGAVSFLKDGNPASGSSNSKKSGSGGNNNKPQSGKKKDDYSNLSKKERRERRRKEEEAKNKSKITV